MPFTYDIFISYGHLDDEDPAGEEKGWVDLLAERLPKVIASFTGDKPKVWRDESTLHGNEKLRGAICEGVSGSLVLIPVVSPRYVQSEWCRTELETFSSAVLPAADEPSFSTRIFKVIKSPLLYEHLMEKEAEQLRDMKAYSFFEMKDDSPDEFSPDVEPSKDQRYWVMLRRLAQDISNKLVALKHRERPQSVAAYSIGPAAEAGSGPQLSVVTPARVSATLNAVIAANGANSAKIVYLAETTSDLAKARELVRDELQQRGHGVLPEQKLPLAEVQQTEAIVRTDLARCALSVHLVGTRYGSTPEDDARSIVRIQEEVAAEHGATEKSFLRILWMPPGLSTPALEISDPRQKSFIEELRTRETAQAELLQNSIEELKTRIVEKLNPPAQAPRDRHSKIKKIYLICESHDWSTIGPISDYLFEQNFEVINWQDEGASDKLMEYHHKNLRDCDAALIYFGNGDEPWVRKNLDDLEKAYGYGREEDWAANALYVAAPPNEQKERFRTHVVPYVIRNFRSFDPNDLRDFVGAVRAAAGGH